jgi:hypothetical protein
MGKEFIKHLAKVYERIVYERKYIEKGEHLTFKWYEKIYNELFSDDISKIKNATRMDALIFYDTYITYMSDGAN